MRNLSSSLRRRRCSMSEFDGLPAPLRAWLRDAALPWSARSALRIWTRALRAARGDTARALAALDRAERRTLSRDAARIWGRSHPAATPAPLALAA